MLFLFVRFLVIRDRCTAALAFFRAIASRDGFCFGMNRAGSRWRLYPAGFTSLSSSRGVKPSAAFTLVELLTVISIVAVLCGIVVAVGHRAVEASHVARAKAELAALSSALEEYRRICGDYPRTSDGARLVQSLIGRQNPRNETIAIRSLIEPARFSFASATDPFTDSNALLIDPWEQPYRYSYKTQSPWTNSSYVLYSIGGDGRDSPTLLAGGLINSGPVENADNLHANRP